MTDGSFTSNVLKQFKKNRLAKWALWVIIFLFFIAIFAPLLANNRPLFIYTSFKTKYEQNYRTLEWLFTASYYRLFEGNKELVNDSYEKIKLNINLMSNQLNTDKKKELNSLMHNFLSNHRKLVKAQEENKLYPFFQTIKGKYYIFPYIKDIYINYIDNNVIELKKIESIILNNFSINRVELKRKIYFPAFASLDSLDVFFIFVFITFCLYKRINTLSIYISKKIKLLFERIFLIRFLLILMPGLIIALLWSILSLNVNDNFNYKNHIERLSSSDYYLMPIVPFGENENILEHSREKPTWLMGKDVRAKRKNWHWLGTDTNGRDVLTRIIYGSRISMSVGFVSVSIYVTIGIILGALAGYYRGWVDILISRLIEIMMTFPVFFLILIVLAMLKPSIMNIMIVIGITGWTGVARLIRGEFLRLVGQDFVLAAKALGAKGSRIIFTHILPNAIGPVLVAATFGVAGAILTESALSFLGFGVPQPTASWGDILNNGRNYIQETWWLTIFPGIMIFLTITSYNLVGEGLRDAMDPRLKS